MTTDERTLEDPGTARPGPVRADRTVQLVAVGAVLAIGAAYLVSVARGVPLSHAVEDPSVTLEGNPYTGIMSALGIGGWWTAATVALFAGFMVRRLGGDVRTSHFLLLGGVLSIYLAADDRFMFHDHALTSTPVPQPAVMLLMVLLIALYFWSFREVVKRTEWSLLGVAGAMFLASLGLDFVDDLGKYLDAWEGSAAFVFGEDALKWLAIVGWATFYVRVSAVAIVRAAGPRTR